MQIEVGQNAMSTYITSMLQVLRWRANKGGDSKFTAIELYFSKAKFYLGCNTTCNILKEESTEKKKIKCKEGGKPLMESP